MKQTNKDSVADFEKIIRETKNGMSEKFDQCKNKATEILQENYKLKKDQCFLKNLVDNLLLNLASVMKNLTKVNSFEQIYIDWSNQESDFEQIDRHFKRLKSDYPERYRKNIKYNRQTNKSERRASLPSLNLERPNRDIKSKHKNFDDHSSDIFLSRPEANNPELQDTLVNLKQTSSSFKVLDKDFSHDSSVELERLEVFVDNKDAKVSSDISNEDMPEYSYEILNQDHRISKHKSEKTFKSKLKTKSTKTKAESSRNSQLIDKIEDGNKKVAEIEIKNKIGSLKDEKPIKNRKKETYINKNNNLTKIQQNQNNIEIKHKKLLRAQTYQQEYIKHVENSQEEQSSMDSEEDVQYKQSQSDKRNLKMKALDSGCLLNAMIDESLITKLKIELNDYPYGAMILNDCSSIIYCNKHVNSNLLYNNYELLETNFQHLINKDHQDRFTTVIADKARSMTKNLAKNLEQEDELTQLELDMWDKDNNQFKFEVHIKAMSNYEQRPEDQKIFYMLYLIPLRLKLEEDIPWVVDPRSFGYILWTMCVMIVIIILTWVTPYNLAFEPTRRTDWFENFVTILFMCDIVLNFNLALEENLNIIVYNRTRIALSYLQGWFVIDIVSTIPIEIIFNLKMNVQILKVLKLFRLFRFVKFQKLQRITQFSASEFNKDFQNFMKRNQGWIFHFKNILLVLLFSHLYTVGFQQYNIELHNGDKEWLQDQFQLPQEDKENLDIQIQLLAWHIKFMMGLSDVQYTETSQVLLQLLWTLISLSLLGWCIGNVASYLSYSNQEHMEQNNSFNQFSELCILNNIEARIYNNLMRDLNDYQDKQNDKEFLRNCSILSKNVMVQLESGMQKEFIGRFNLFSKLDTKIIRSIKNNSRMESKRFLLRLESVVHEIYMVVEGAINVQDKDMTLKNMQGVHEIFGFAQFKQYCVKKYNVHLDQVQHNSVSAQQAEDEHPNSDVKFFNDIKGHLTNLKSSSINLMPMAGLPNVNNAGYFGANPSTSPTMNQLKPNSNFSHEERRHSTQRFVEDIMVKIRFPDQAITAEDTKQYVIDQEWLEDLMLEDFDTFYMFQKQDKRQFEKITPEERKHSEKIMKRFHSSSLPAAILLKDGTTYDINYEFMVNSGIQKIEKLIGISFLDFMQEEIEKWTNFGRNKVRLPIETVSSIEQGNYQFNFEGLEQIITVVRMEKHKIVRSENQFNTEMKINKQFYKYKKSMLDTMVMQFEIKEVNGSNNN